MEHVYASIDLGSDSIKLVVCELYLNHLNLLAATSTPSRGIKKGLIVDPDLAKKSLELAFKSVEDMLGIKIKKVITSVPNHLADYKIIKGDINISGDLITAKDMFDSYKKGIKANLMPDDEFVTVVPIDFKINNKTVMKDPKGFPGKTLMGRAMMVTTPKKNVYSVAGLVESLGVEIVDISTSSIGDINTFKNSDLEKSISAIINIGAEITTVSLYNKCIPVNTKIIGAGGKDIDKDLAYMYRIDVKEARKIKEKFALAYKRNANISEVYETENVDNEKIKINQVEATEVIQSRLTEILSLAKDELNGLTNKPIQYIIVTGGTSNMLDFEYCLADIFPTGKCGNVKLIGVRNNKYSTVIGNIIYFLNTLKLKGMDYSMLSEDDMESLASPKGDNSDDTMLGKVFGYFFGE
jgi:cell division protein FtsA